MCGGVAWGMLTLSADMMLFVVTLCDPYLSALEEFVKMRYTNRRYCYLCNVYLLVLVCIKQLPNFQLTEIYE